jgi:hypothetical protein
MMPSAKCSSPRRTRPLAFRTRRPRQTPRFTRRYRSVHAHRLKPKSQSDRDWLHRRSRRRQASNLRALARMVAGRELSSTRCVAASSIRPWFRTPQPLRRRLQKQRSPLHCPHLLSMPRPRTPSHPRRSLLLTFCLPTPTARRLRPQCPPRPQVHRCPRPTRLRQFGHRRLRPKRLPRQMEPDGSRRSPLLTLLAGSHQANWPGLQDQGLRTQHRFQHIRGSPEALILTVGRPNPLGNHLGPAVPLTRRKRRSLFGPRLSGRQRCRDPNPQVQWQTGASRCPLPAPEQRRRSDGPRAPRRSLSPLFPRPPSLRLQCLPWLNLRLLCRTKLTLTTPSDRYRRQPAGQRRDRRPRKMGNTTRQ